MKINRNIVLAGAKMNRIKIIEKKSEEDEFPNIFLEELHRLEKEGFGEAAYGYEQLKEMFISENYNFYVAIDTKINKMVGYLIIYDSIDVFEIIKIFVETNKRKTGIASTLLQFFLDRERNKEVLLEVRESNEVAIKFYENKKFEKISVRKKYYKDNDEDALIMKLNK